MSSQLAISMTDPDTSTSKPRISPVGWLAMLLAAALMGYLVYYNIQQLHAGHGGPAAHEAPPLWGIGILPFIALLGCIAILPLLPATHHWWENNLNRLGVALACGGAALAYYFFADGPQRILPVLNHAVPAEYVPFIVLLFSLYVISGGICLKGDLAARPMTNTALLAIGALIASFVGTTGASMLLIRPLLQTNSERRHVVHTVVFFIFLVSNIGGCLLPIGDPPLFLGYLRGVSFFWTFHLVIEWAICCGILLIIYFLLDSHFYRKETVFDIRRDETEKRPLRLTGWINILWLAGIVACVATVNHETTLIHAELKDDTPIAKVNGGRGADRGAITLTDSAGHTAVIDLTEAATIGAVCDLINADERIQVSAEIDANHLLVTDQAGGAGELAILDGAAVAAHDQPEHAASDGHQTTAARDLGIAGTSADGSIAGSAINPGWTPFPFLREILMFALVGLSLLTTPRGVREDNQFNYAAILEVAALFIGIFIAMQVPIDVLRVYGPNLGLTQPWHFFWATGSLSSFLDNAPTYVVFFETASSFEPARLPTTVIREPLLVGISLGAVFMGAMTYIGNGPNFMVKAIAEQSGIRMPSFFGYMFKYSIPLLIPVFVIITVLFLMGGEASHDALPAAGETPAAHVESLPAHDDAAAAGAPGVPGAPGAPGAPGH